MRTGLVRLGRGGDDVESDLTELVFLYTHHDEFDNAALTMIAHPTESWKHIEFKEIIGKINNSENYYKAISFYFDLQPSLLNDLLVSQASKLDHTRVVVMLKRNHPIIKPYLTQVQPVLTPPLSLL
jgi:clathrin heavy chain